MGILTGDKDGYGGSDQPKKEPILEAWEQYQTSTIHDIDLSDFRRLLRNCFTAGWNAACKEITKIIREVK